MADEPKEFNDLPIEMQIYIFQFLSVHECVTEYAKTCSLWRENIALHILAPELLRIAAINQRFKSNLEKNKWTEHCEDIDLILSLYDKYDYYTSK